VTNHLHAEAPARTGKYLITNPFPRWDVRIKSTEQASADRRQNSRSKGPGHVIAEFSDYVSLAYRLGQLYRQRNGYCLPRIPEVTAATSWLKMLGRM